MTTTTTTQISPITEYLHNLSVRAIVTLVDDGFDVAWARDIIEHPAYDFVFVECRISRYGDAVWTIDANGRGIVTDSIVDAIDTFELIASVPALVA